MKIQLKHVGTDVGFCCVYYKSERGTMFCLMDDGYGGEVVIKFLICSSDGEPSHEVDATKYDIPIIGADSGLEKDADDFVRALKGASNESA